MLFLHQNGSVYLNSNSIISVSDYYGVHKFLLREDSSLVNEKFSLVRYSEGPHVKEVIAVGTAEQVCTGVQPAETSKKVLRG